MLTGAYAARFRELAAAMPPVCRAAGEERRSTHVVLEAIAGLVDATVRRALPDRLLGGHRPGMRSPLADRWVVALTGDAAALDGVSRSEAERLAEPLQRWFATAHQLDSPVRVCLRLTEPAGDEHASPDEGSSLALSASCPDLRTPGSTPRRGEWSSPSRTPRTRACSCPRQ